MRAKTKNAAENTVKNAETFTKEQLLNAGVFENRKDILTALLSADEVYTVEAAKEIIENYMKGQVI